MFPSMEPEQRQILRKWRVELVENINVKDGLYTQLLSKNVLASRTVNRIKNNKTGEEQVEELLDELQKKDCFDQFCDALIADGQEHIVRKFLKQTKSSVDASKPDVTTATTSSSSVQTNDSASVPSESTDSLERTSQSWTPSLVIRESDNKHVYIRISNDEASPSKILRSSEVDQSLVVYEPGETRYAMKHYLSDSVDLGGKGVVVNPATKDSISALVLDNPQSIMNCHVSDPARYLAAFTPQSSSSAFRSENMRQKSDEYHPVLSAASVAFTDLPSTKNEPNSLSRQELQNLLRPNSKNTHPNLLNHATAQNRGKFVTLSQNITASNLKVSHFTSPHKCSGPSDVLTPSKEPGPIMSSSPPGRDPGFMDQFGLSRSDAVDTMALKESISIGRPDFSFNKMAYYDEDLRSKFNHSNPLLPYTEVSCSSFTSDEIDIDLPDGCVNVKVEHCSEEFFHSNYKKSYPMRQMPRGYALIINVNEVVGKPARTGTNFDRDNLCNLLSQLHFNIVVYDDKDGLSAQEMVLKLKSFAKLEQHHQADACFICLLSHGEEEYIFGTDGKRIPLNEIFMLFDNNNCKGLIGKPKVFVIQACRGGSLDRGVMLDETDGGSVPNRSGSQLPSMSDMLICYPTLMGYYAWRNRARGSWYIEAIVQIFMRYAKNEDVCAMLNRVNHLVSRKVSESCLKEMNQMSQMSEYKSTLRYPHFYLFPGIAIKSTPQQTLQNAGVKRRL